MTAAKTIKAELTALRRELESTLPSREQPDPCLGASRAWGLSLGRRAAQGYDRILAPLFEVAAASRVALAAVGGYGRGAVALRSDLDVRILARSAADAEHVVDAVLYPLWDAGLSIGHQTLLLGDALELAREDLSTATSMLDWRLLSGDAELSKELLWRVRGSLFSTSELSRFAARLSEEVHRRHERFGDSVFLLEPEVKNGAGGLRDVDVIRWVGAARYGTGEIEGLLRAGAIVPREAQELADAEERLWRIRHLLHAHAGRRSDRLVFDEQELLAVLLGYGEGGDAVERMMSEHYRAARAITRGVSMMLSRASLFGDRRRPKDEDLGEGVRLFDGAVTLADTSRLAAEPALSLRILAIAVERDRPLYHYAREAIMRHSNEAEWCKRLRGDPAAVRLFVELVTSRRETALLRGSALREMHDLGLLLAMIPEFLPVVGRVHHDVYHVYTVDVHSVAAVDRLAALARGQLAKEHPLPSRLAAEVANPAALAFATLLHDVGKAIGGKDHSLRGAEMCRTILERLGFRNEDIDEVATLIREHLTLYRLATRRDVDDPATLAEVTRAVGSRETLRNLFLLTLVDVSTTSPTSMTSWKAHMLDELYLAADAALSGAELEVNRADLMRQEIVAFARGYLDGEPHQDSEIAFLPGFLASMPDRYLAASSAEAIVAHASAARRFRPPISIEIVPSSHPDAAEVCVVADDRPGLLAMIAAAFAGSRLSVLGAQVYSRRAAGAVQAVDLFWVQRRADGSLLDPPALSKLDADLRRLLSGGASPSEVARARVPQRTLGPRIPARVLLDHRASREQTVLEVTAMDRPGLLFTIANTLFELGLTIAIAKINTEGTRVADVFYVTERDGQKVSPGARVAEIERALLTALGEAEGEREGRPGSGPPVTSVS